MSDVVIKVENLGKKYTLRHEKRESYTTFRELVTAVRAPGKIRGYISAVPGPRPGGKAEPSPLTRNVRSTFKGVAGRLRHPFLSRSSLLTPTPSLERPSLFTPDSSSASHTSLLTPTSSLGMPSLEQSVMTKRYFPWTRK